MRLTPLSRKPGFSKTAFSHALGEAGIDYLHLRALGNPKWNRPGFNGSAAELSTAQDTFTNTVLTSTEARSAMEEIRRHSRDRKIALLCFERDPACCHRTMILTHMLMNEHRLTAG